VEEFLKLIGRIAEQDFEDVRVIVEKASRNNVAVGIVLSVTFGDDTCSRWNVICGKPFEHRLKLGFADFLEFGHDHPLLWQFQQQTGSAFFHGVPRDVRAAVGTLYEAHQQQAQGWIPFDAYFNRVLPLSALLATGNGLLARGPLSLLMLYRDVLNAFGTEVYLRFVSEPEQWDGHEWKPLNGTEMRILALGSSYVIGASWSARLEQD
jgi:hypothetical protein